MELNDYLAIAFVITLLSAITFEAFIFGVAWFYADEVECTPLWCKFTMSSNESYSTTYVETTCFRNRVEINCSEINSTGYIR